MSDLDPGKNSAQAANANKTNADATPANVKIYERPERTGPSPVMIVVVILVLVIVGVIAYKMFVHK